MNRYNHVFYGNTIMSRLTFSDPTACLNGTREWASGAAARPHCRFKSLVEDSRGRAQASSWPPGLVPAAHTAAGKPTAPTLIASRSADLQHTIHPRVSDTSRVTSTGIVIAAAAADPAFSIITIPCSQPTTKPPLSGIRMGSTRDETSRRSRRQRHHTPFPYVVGTYLRHTQC
ncbi:hypothetical protein C2E23DRAFT_248975 [Lenzites betulinus]|nr:hypothetical protein C2E23DRAFT_248975 [Lenzites betulinus]